LNIALWLDRAARSVPELPAVAVGDRSVSTYGRLAQRAAGLATALKDRHGLAGGDRVAIATSNHAAYLEVLLGAWWGGFAAVPINAKLHPAEIAWIVEHAGARVVFASPQMEAGLGAHHLAGVIDMIAFDSLGYQRLTAQDSAPLVARGPDDLAWLFYTSGTTGRPKGAMLTHRNLIAMSMGYLADVDATQPGDILLHAAPMSHGSGLYAMAHVCRQAVNAVPESGGFDAGEVLTLLQRRPGISMFAAPTMVQRLVDHSGDVGEGFRTLTWGGAPMHPGQVRRALDRFGPHLAQIYGQGETPMTITVLSRDDVADRTHPRWAERLGSAGVANSMVEVRVADPEDRSLPDGEAGEVQVRGDTVMAGYWGDETATRATLGNGWLRTGDVGVFDEDGYLTLKDRSKDVIISGGSNIYPREVEDVLLTHPSVFDISVIGRPDPEWGEVVVAYVVGDPDPRELDRMCLDRIARFKRPKHYVFVPSLPRNNTGKILRNEIRDLDRKREKEMG